VVILENDTNGIIIVGVKTDRIDLHILKVGVLIIVWDILDT
jgi:hypothetical protein